MSDDLPDGYVEACPECDVADVWAREWCAGGVRTDETNRYRCGNCDVVFGESVIRPAYRPAEAAVTDGGWDDD